MRRLLPSTARDYGARRPTVHQLSWKSTSNAAVATVATVATVPTTGAVLQWPGATR